MGGPRAGDTGGGRGLRRAPAEDGELLAVALFGLLPVECRISDRAVPNFVGASPFPGSATQSSSRSLSREENDPAASVSCSCSRLDAGRSGDGLKQHADRGGCRDHDRRRDPAAEQCHGADCGHDDGQQRRLPIRRERGSRELQTQ
jgi:hypothetical protein